MITRDQMEILFMMKKCKHSFFSTLPIEVIKHISDYGQNPKSEIATALQHAAYARCEDVEALKAMLKKNPRLLLQAGNVRTPGGDEVKRVTLYEFILGAGGDELARIVQRYFAKIPNGEQERLRQYERYKPHIKGMLKQKPYDLKPLIKLILKATPEEANELLHKDMIAENDLCNALIQFRKDWAPKVITKPCMHYNYASLKHAFNLLRREWNNLYKTSNDNYDKINLVWRQVIGFEMRRLPGIDRCLMAQGLVHVIKEKKVVAGPCRLQNMCASAPFPVTVADDCIDGLGWDFAVDFFGDRELEGSQFLVDEQAKSFGTFMSNKKCKLTTLRQRDSTQQQSRCVLC